MFSCFSFHFRKFQIILVWNLRNFEVALTWGFMFKVLGLSSLRIEIGKHYFLIAGIRCNFGSYIIVSHSIGVLWKIKILSLSLLSYNQPWIRLINFLACALLPTLNFLFVRILPLGWHLVMIEILTSFGKWWQYITGLYRSLWIIYTGKHIRLLIIEVLVLFLVLLLQAILLWLLIGPYALLDGRAIIISIVVLRILKLQLRLMVLYSQLVYFSIFLLTYQYSFVKELAILTRVESVVLHLNVLLVIVGRQIVRLIDDFRRFKLILFILRVIIMEHWIQSFLLITLIEHWPPYYTFVNSHTYAIQLIILKVLRVIDHTMLLICLTYRFTFMGKVSNPRGRHTMVLNFDRLFSNW